MTTIPSRVRLFVLILGLPGTICLSGCNAGAQKASDQGIDKSREAVASLVAALNDARSRAVAERMPVRVRAIGGDWRNGWQTVRINKSNDPIFEVLTSNQQKRSNDLLLQTNSGKRISVSVVASPIGHLGSGAIIVFRDITKELAEEHEQAEFISTASHEMRTPVASIEGYLGLALNPATAKIDDKARDFITMTRGAWR